MRRLTFGIFLVSLVTLVTELVMTRVLDVLFYPNMSYLVITSAIFGFGLAGAIAAAWNEVLHRDPEKTLPVLAGILAVSILLIRPVMNAFPFNYYELVEHSARELLYFGATYVVLIVPFVAAGLIMAVTFATYARRIRRLYFWDLCGAAVGSILLIPLIGPLGPGSILMLAAAAALIGSGLFSGSTRWRVVAVVGAVALASVPAFRYPGYLAFSDHMDKRGVKTARSEGRVELTRWDPIARIDIIDNGANKHIAYDGGTQSSFFYAFDGDFGALARALEAPEPDSAQLEVMGHRFWRAGVLASHYLKRGTGADVLVIGSAGGQETVAALTFGAHRVDAVEMVPTVVSLRTGKYADYIGRVFDRPEVHNIVAEGRNYLKASGRQYDIIQIFSNYTSSSIASGGSALGPVYLETADAYQEYFSHLKPNGILHINDHTYPRAVATAALAWRRMGRTNFRAHVAIFQQAKGVDYLPTMLIKMQPWTQSELDDLQQVFRLQFGGAELMVEDPLRPEHRYLSDDFFSGDFPRDLAKRIPVDLTPVTDDRPFFAAMRKHFGVLSPDPSRYVTVSTAAMLNSRLAGGVIPLDWVHLFGVGILAILFASALVLVPLRYSSAGKVRWPHRGMVLTYFSSLGMGFIIIEIVFIQLFMQLIGSPAYTFSVVIFALLLAAGIGSGTSERLGITPQRFWALPFLGVVITGLLGAFVVPSFFHALLGLPLLGRCAVTGGFIFPLGFFLGMPFPLGILALEGRPRSAVAWAWGMNGLFTVIGGLAAALLSHAFGFRITLTFALAAYLLALYAFGVMRRSALVPVDARIAEPGGPTSEVVPASA